MTNITVRPSTEDIMRYIRPLSMRLKDYEIDTIKSVIQQYITPPAHHDDYPRKIEHCACMFQIYKLYKRLFEIQLTQRDEYSISFNPSEIAVIQMGLFGITESNTTAAILFSKIHKKTM